MNRTSKSPTPRKRARQTLAFLRDGDPSDTKVSTVVFGPYRDRGKYRLVVVEGKKRKSLVTETIDEAEQLKAKLSAAIVESAARTVSEVLPEYEAYLTDERTAASAPYRRRMVERFLGAESTLGGFTPRRASDLYAAEVARVTVRGRPTAAAAHRSYLSETKRFFRWAEARGYVSSNPFADVRPVGRPKVGKAQLRIDEARRFTQTAVEAAQAGDRAAPCGSLGSHAGGTGKRVAGHVAASLGHASFAITAKHYADPSAIADRNTQEVTSTLLGAKPDVAVMIRQASELSPTERTELRAALDRLCEA